MEKYPRTFHLPFSPEVHSDDKTIDASVLETFLNTEVVISEKLDGGNACMKPEGVFARSHKLPTSCETFDYIKNKHYFSKKYSMNPNYWYFGENMFAIHSIPYTELIDSFYLFNVLNHNTSEWLPYDEVIAESIRMEFELVPEVFRGTFKTIKEIQEFMDSRIDKGSYLGGECEGFVMRKAGSFPFSEFSDNVVKYVRAGHVQTDEHWRKNWKPQKINKD